MSTEIGMEGSFPPSGNFVIKHGKKAAACAVAAGVLFVGGCSRSTEGAPAPDETPRADSTSQTTEPAPAETTSVAESDVDLCDHVNNYSDPKWGENLKRAIQIMEEENGYTSITPKCNTVGVDEFDAIDPDGQPVVIVFEGLLPLTGEGRKKRALVGPTAADAIRAERAYPLW